MNKNDHILIRNIYYMLSYAFTALKQEHYKDVEREAFENIHNLFAAILAKGVGLQIKRGLHREYLPQNEELRLSEGNKSPKLFIARSRKH